MKKYFDMLGHKVVDQVTGFKGVAQSISFDLYGCVQIAVTPEHKADSERKWGEWFDAKRIKVLSKKRVMTPPDFSIKAGAEKGPAMNARQK